MSPLTLGFNIFRDSPFASQIHSLPAPACSVCGGCPLSDPLASGCVQPVRSTSNSQESRRAVFEFLELPPPRP